MRTKIFVLAGVSVFLISIHSRAQQLNSSSTQALSKTQALLRNRTNRQKFIKGNRQAQIANDFVNKISGGNAKTSQAIYSLAADVFANVVKDAHGDPAKMQQEMAKFRKDPSAFAAKWTPEQKQKLKELSQQLPGLSAQQN